MKNKDFQIVYKKGKSYANKYLIMYVLENNSCDPMDIYKMHGKITDSTDKWAIDGNIIKYNGELYYFWSGWEENRNVRQNIYIAKMKNPFEFGKFMSYFACCLATCPWRVCCTQEGK